MNAQSDATVERAFIAREPWALEALYAQHSTTLYSAAFSVLNNAEDAQDCVHDVLLRIWRRPNTFVSGKGSLKAFVSVCIRNEAVSRLRVRNREPELHRRLTARAENDEFEPFDFVEHNRLIGALQALPESQRRVVVLSYFKHLTHREIAERLNEPIGTIKSRLSAALGRLRGALSKDSTHE